MRVIKIILYIMFTIVVASSISLAQENTAEPTESVPETNTAIQPGIYVNQDMVIILSLAVIIALAGLAAGFAIPLYKSAPPWVYDIIRPFAEMLVAELDEATGNTDNEIDDKMVEVIKKFIAEELAKMSGIPPK